ncbi:MAG: hypothetical protein E2O56_07015 [Gammaproteobacteria bacterium]|nr:MAG: hypothetical protein E2O56_07015 [Gammaproteobacteria bacterium]
MSLDEACKSEIEELHAFIQAWMRGTLPRTTQAFERFDNPLSDTFLVVHPSGQSDDKTSICQKVYGAHGVKPDDFTIEIRDIRSRVVHPPWCLLTYEEWQSSGGKETGRISSVLFRETNGESGDGVAWVHLHETCLSEER